MWDGYLGAIKETIADSPHMDAEKIDIVVDRFHVAKNCRDAFDHLRKAELRRLKKEALWESMWLTGNVNAGVR